MDNDVHIIEIKLTRANQYHHFGHSAINRLVVEYCPRHFCRESVSGCTLYIRLSKLNVGDERLSDSPSVMSLLPCARFSLLSHSLIFP
jgi:hypothetical protein